MKKKVTVNGELLRKEREKRAWTQEELSERSQLGVRTLRRLEAGHGSLETLRRVSQALELAPEVPLAVAGPPTSVKEQLRMDPVTLLLSGDLCQDDFPQKLAERVGSVRRHLASTLGTVLPGVRLRDHLSVPAGCYEILIHEQPVASGRLQPGKILGIAKAELLEQLEGEPAQDPAYGMPGRWLAADQRPQASALGIMVFDPISVLATHLTETLRRHAPELLGIEDVHFLLETLEQPHLVAEVVPHKITLARLRSLLRELLRERVSIRNLRAILEDLADRSEPGSIQELVEGARRVLGQEICQEYADDQDEILCLRLGDSRLPAQELAELVRASLTRMRDVGRTPVVLVAAEMRRPLRDQLQAEMVAVLSQEEVHPRFRLRTLTPG